MSIRLYLDFAINDQIVPLNKKQANYLARVLKLKNNQIIKVFNGINGEFEGIFKSDNKDFHIEISTQIAALSNPNTLNLCYAPVKNVKTDFIAKKAAELGVTSIQPIITDYTVIRKVNQEKLKLSMIEGIEQCRRNDLISIKPIITLKKFLQSDAEQVILFFDETGKGSLPNQIAKELKTLQNNNITILIGPEGGFSKQEAALIRQTNNQISLSLGPRS